MGDLGRIRITGVISRARNRVVIDLLSIIASVDGGFAPRKYDALRARPAFYRYPLRHAFCSLAQFQGPGVFMCGPFWVVSPPSASPFTVGSLARNLFVSHQGRRGRWRKTVSNNYRGLWGGGGVCGYIPVCVACAPQYVPRICLLGSHSRHHFHFEGAPARPWSLRKQKIAPMATTSCPAAMVVGSP